MSKQPNTPRVVLEGVERVSYGEKEGNYELTPFPSCLKSCLAFLGENYPYEYSLGTSGLAFRLLWNSKM